MLPNQQIKTTAALALALAATAPAAASAMPRLDPSGSTQTHSQASPIVRVIAPKSGFDWGDAGIGAGGGIALSILGLGVTLTVTQRRASRPKPTT